MAEDNKQGFWNYFWEDTIKDNPLVNMIATPVNLLRGRPDEDVERTKGAASWLLRGINNVATGGEWGDENTTFAQAMQGQVSPYRESAIITTPPIQPTLNEVAEQDVANGGVDINQVVTSGVTPSQTSGPALNENEVPNDNANFVDVTKLEVEDMLKNQEKEENIEDENVFQTAWRWIVGTKNEIADSHLQSSLDAYRSAMERHMMLSYDPDSKDVIELVINSPQGYSDDFWNTLYDRGEHNQEIFDNLFTDYVASLQIIAYSNLSEEDKAVAADAVFNEFYKEATEKQLFRAFANDHYTDGLYRGIFGEGVKGWNGRMKDKFTQEQLNEAAKRIVKPGVYTPTKEEFADFLEMYDYNREVRNSMTLDGYYGNTDRPDKRNITYQLTEESISQLQYSQASKILEPVRVELLKMVDEGKITPTQQNEIENKMITQTNDFISNMHFWLDTPLALYVSASNKSPGEQTNGERAIVGYGPWLQKLMSDYVDAVGRWELEVLKTVDNNGNIHAPDIIDGMSVNDFFKEAIKEANDEIGVDLYAGESAIDAFQLINNNISYLYYSGKGNWLRRTWQDVQQVGGGVGYTAGELTALGFNGILQGTDYLAKKGLKYFTGKDYVSGIPDYVLADRASALSVGLDRNRNLGFLNPEFVSLLTNFGLGLMENAPEFLGELAATKAATPGELFKINGILRKTNKLSDIKNAVQTKQRVSAISNAIGKFRKAINFPASQNGRGWLLRMVNGGLKSLEGENLITNNIIKIGQNIAKGAISDQLIDSMVSYYDTEAYSDLSFFLSTGLTGITEILAPAARDYQLMKRLGNFLNRREWSRGTAWKVLSYLNTDEQALKRLEALLGKGNVTVNTMSLIGEQRDKYEDIMKAALEKLPSDVRDGLKNFGKQAMFEQLRKLNKVDWQSAFGQGIIRLVNNRDANVADMFKFIFGVPGTVEVGGFVSKILLKDPGAAAQTRLLKKDYDMALDVAIEGGFRRRLKEGFTIDDLKQIQKQTSYKGLVEGGTPNATLFQKEGDKYFLTSEGAKKFELDVSEYTESMRRADLRRATEEETKQLLDSKTKQLLDNKGISPELINKLASSGAFQKMVDDISTVVCKIR